MPETLKPPDPAEPQRFFVVWSPQGGPPVVRHANFGAARSAAIRLTMKFPGQDVFVLQSCWGKIGEPIGEPAAGVETGPETAPETGPLDPGPPVAEPEVVL
jgi:hypothetical protein